MPFLKPPPKIQPVKVWDYRAQKCGQRNTVFSTNGDKYIGEWLDNKKHGKGTQLWRKSGDIYYGGWLNGKRDGYGTYNTVHSETKEYVAEYCGVWKNGMKHGHGTFFYSSCEVYDGEWSEGLKSGWGRMHYSNGDFYEGEWLKDKHHGDGQLQLANDNRYAGGWKDGEKSGHGTFYYPHKGKLYQGVWLHGVAKCGTLSDFGWEEASAPTKYPIPKLQLLDPALVLWEAQSRVPYQNQS